MELIKWDPLRWDPLRELGSLRGELNRWFGGRGGNGFGAVAAWTPAVDVLEDDKSIQIKVELPEVDKKDIKIELQDDSLVISGERKLEKEEKKKDYTRIERSYGSFMRSFALPDTVDPKKITAECKDGVLRLTLPKNRQAKAEPVKIPVA